jgi:hypothetical protein
MEEDKRIEFVVRAEAIQVFGGEHSHWQVLTPPGCEAPWSSDGVWVATAIFDYFQANEDEFTKMLKWFRCQMEEKILFPSDDEIREMFGEKGN